MKKTLVVSIYGIDGREKGERSLPSEIFNAEANPNLIAQYIRVYLANQRRGTAKTKTRGEVIGSTRKIYRQKGTGRARHGARKAPIFVGGGVVGGPRPRNHSLKLSKKQKRKALCGTLTQTYKEGKIVGLSDESLKVEPKTKMITAFLKALDIYGKKVLFVVPELKEKGLLLAARNIEGVRVADIKSINPYILLNNNKLVFIDKSFEVLQDFILKKNEN